MKLKVAAKIVLLREGKVLIVADPDGKWDFPGGGIEGEERLEAALRRELTEELGTDEVNIGPVVHVDEWFIEKLDLHVVAVFYQGELRGDPTFVLGDEHSKVAWISPEDIATYDATQDTVRALEALAGAK